MDGYSHPILCLSGKSAVTAAADHAARRTGEPKYAPYCGRQGVGSHWQLAHHISRPPDHRPARLNTLHQLKGVLFFLIASSCLLLCPFAKALKLLAVVDVGKWFRRRWAFKKLTQWLPTLLYLEK